MELVPVLLLALFLSLSVIGNAQPKVPAIYVFGDSTADVGNNNYLPDAGSCNYVPYGIDFPGSKPTGRCSNGFNAVDFFARQMGFQMSPPPYFSLPNDTISPVGVNYASGGTGILDSTLGNNNLTMAKQIQYFAATNKSNIVLSKCIFLISAGANDIFAFLVKNPEPNLTQIVQFYNTLIPSYKNHIEALYNLGARKFGIINVGPIGCSPGVRILYNHSGECFDAVNGLVLIVNVGVREMLSNLSSTLKEGMKYSLGSAYAVVSKMIANPEAAGFKNVTSACCEAGAPLCIPNGAYCKNRTEYLFWDNLHATQRAYEEVAQEIYNGSPPIIVTPINFKQLVEDDLIEEKAVGGGRMIDI